MKAIRKLVRCVSLVFLAGAALKVWSGRPFEAAPYLFFALMCALGERSLFGKLLERMELEQRHPEEPWKWNSSWAMGLGQPSGLARSRILGIVGLVLLCLGFPLYLTVVEEVRRGKPGALALLILPAGGFIALVSYLLARRRARKFGSCELTLETHPGALGGKLKARLLVRGILGASQGVRIRLVCKRTYVSGTGKNRSQHVELKWEESSVVQPASTGRETLVEADFDVPYDLEQSRETDRSDRIDWEMSFESAEPGLDFEASFLVPVFKTSRSDSSRTQGVVSRENAREVAGWGAPPAHYRIEHTPRGELYVMKRGGARGAGMAFTIFGLVFAVVGGGIPMIFQNAGPLWAVLWLFPVVFGGLGLILMLVGVSEILGRSSLAIESERVVVRRNYLFFTSAKEVSRQEIRRIELTSEVKGGTGLWYDLKFHTEGSRAVTLASRIPDKREAEILLVELEKKLAA